MSSRPPIPEPVKRQVRQRCGFGCVICGCPIYDYDHIVEYAAVHEHEADNLTLLCAQHHRDKTAGRLSRRRVQSANANPRNTSRGMSGIADVSYDLDDMVVKLGKTLFLGFLSSRFPLLNVDGLEVLGLRRDGDWLALNLRLFDEDNHPVLIVREGQLRHATSKFDIQFVGQRLVMREAARQISLDITFSPDRGLVIEHGRFWAQGYEFTIGAEHGFRCVSADQDLGDMVYVTMGGMTAIYKGERSNRPAQFAIDLGDGGLRTAIGRQNVDPGPVEQAWIESGAMSDFFNEGWHLK